MLTKNQVVTLLRFTADLLCSVEPQGLSSPDAPAGEPAALPAKPRGRPRKDTAAPAEQAPAEVPLTEPNPVVAVPAEPVPAVKGLSYEALQKLIQPLIQASRGPEVKAVLDTFAPDDFEVTKSNHYLLSLLAKRPGTHADFVKKIEALLI